MSRDELELIRDHCEAFVDAFNRAGPQLGFDSLNERETLVGLHNAIVRAFQSEKMQRRSA